MPRKPYQIQMTARLVLEDGSERVSDVPIQARELRLSRIIGDGFGILTIRWDGEERDYDGRPVFR